MDLKKIAKDINKILSKKREESELNFIEEEHVYYMKDIDGIVKSDFLSVSKLVKKFYTPFDSEAVSLRMTNGDVEKQKKLLEEWKNLGEYSTNLGSRVHFILESDLINQYNNYKEIRQPIFSCDNKQIKKSDSMVIAGKKFLDLMHERGAVLLDTEIVLGDSELGYTGQPDKIWLMLNKDKTDFGFVVTDWKTNQPKNFEVKPYSKRMHPPFNDYHDTSLSHYYIQLPLYARLLLKMLKGSKYEDKKLLGCVVVLLKDDGTYVEYKVPKEVTQKILNIDLKKYIK